jgi:hypothetical protein
MLLEWPRRGWDSGGEELGAFIRERESAFLADLGGEANVSAMDRALVRRLCGIEMDWLLLTAKFDRAAKLPLDRLVTLTKARSQNATVLSQLVKTLGGPGRRPSETKGEIVVRRFQETTLSTAQDSQEPVISEKGDTQNA